MLYFLPDWSLTTSVSKFKAQHLPSTSTFTADSPLNSAFPYLPLADPDAAYRTGTRRDDVTAPFLAARVIASSPASFWRPYICNGCGLSSTLYGGLEISYHLQILLPATVEYIVCRDVKQGIAVLYSQGTQMFWDSNINTLSCFRILASVEPIPHPQPQQRPAFVQRRSG